ncbi:MAG: DUF559 domain-containing protein [Thermoleophilaceae bacterium]
MLTLATRQHGVVTASQLHRLGLDRDSIRHRLRTGRLHQVRPRIYVVGRPELTREGVWLAGVLGCGRHAVLSHGSAGALWGIRPDTGKIEVSVPAGRRPRSPGIVVHRSRTLTPREVTHRHGIRVTTPVRTLLDLAARLTSRELEAAINEADKLELTDPERLRSALGRGKGRPGLTALRRTLDRRTFALTDSELERRFLPLVRRAGLPMPETGRWVNGFKVDFYWSELGLVVETDGLRYHRTPAQQARDRLRDQAHVAAGLTCLRFTHAQVAYERHRVQATLEAVVRRLSG